MNYLKIIYAALALLALQPSMAQLPEDRLQSWHQKNPIEKVYLHLDRQDYFAGQTSWFKGYFLSDFMPSKKNSTLFVELINSSGAILAKKVLPVFNGVTYGQIELPDTLSTGTYHFRAYSPLMLNHDKSYLYRRPLRVYGKNSGKKDQSMGSSHLNFFPEGGNLLAGVSNRIAFKATDASGLPLNITAEVKDETGATVATLQSFHDGMGSFNLTPRSDKSYSVSFEGGTFRLPVPISSGLAVSVKSSENRLAYTWQSAGGPMYAPAYVIGQMQHITMFKQPVSGTSGEMNTGELPSGVLQLTFFNTEGLPLAERLVFVNNQEYRLNATLEKEAFSMKPRGKNQWSILFNEALAGNFSVAVTDDNFNEAGPRKNNIISSFLLTSDIPGYVHNPAFYFSGQADAPRAIDLVMLTNGWRRFNWKNVNEEDKKPLYKDPGYISLSGQVNVRGSKKNFAERELLVWMATPDSGRSIEMIKTDAEGRFKMDSIVFFDKAKILFSDVMGDKSKFITVKLDTDSLYQTFDLPRLQTPRFTNTNTSLAGNMQSAYASYNRGSGVLLDNVNIAGRRLTLEELEKKYMSGMFAGNINARTINLTGQFVPQLNIFEWIIGRVPGLTVQRNSQFFDNYQLYFRRQPVQLFLDEMRMQDASFIASIPPNQIALIKIYPQFIGARGNNAAVAIYTKRGDDLNEEMERSGDIVDYDGYSIIKEFYSPDYATPPDIDYRDNRLTLDWQPEVIVDSTQQQIPVRFYNTDRTKKIKIVAEGVTEDGRLLMLEQTVE
ncbi:hypothetical protein ABDK00_009900 [Niabella insulamsoli]|uniref:hypothetical protein n=1 Tax=Niabella insulamsoli TaxID=3144874 RepID=UPI0031FD36F6